MTGIAKPIRLVLALALITATASCGIYRNTVGSLGVGTASARGSNQVNINDITFRSKLSIDGVQKRDLTISVSPVRIDPNAAQEAGRYRATVYCLRSFGSSDTDWAIGPDIPPAQLRIVDDTITLRGSCAAR
ncbi:hypothetical protein [Pseudoruegeria sp. HB172150]|uniref:hypothetical protein n=1 Tax=Pseudoruegeria sp. HB172150 TaxID=2721164 RepID=UPI0015530485|nr:hypothetical protein [Pseudoruegeria sp. HB172150]